MPWHWAACVLLQPAGNHAVATVRGLEFRSCVIVAQYAHPSHSSSSLLNSGKTTQTGTSRIASLAATHVRCSQSICIAVMNPLHVTRQLVMRTVYAYSFCALTPTRRWRWLELDGRRSPWGYCEISLERCSMRLHV